MFCNHCGAQQQFEGSKFCNNCGGVLPVSSAAASPVIAATTIQSIVTPPVKGKNSPLFKWLMVICGIGFIVLIIGAAIQSGSKSQGRASRIASLPTETPSNSLGIKLEPAPTPENWSYSYPSDDMTGKPISQANVTSTNTVNFGFPYQGEQHARLTLRKHPRYGNDVILSIEKGQFLAGVSGVQVLVRFDDGAAMKFWAQGSEDNSTTVLFLGNYAKFVAAARKAKIVRITTPVYQEGSPVFEFNIEGLKDQ